MTASSNNTNDVSGLYSSTDTNSAKPTYYFRGAINNNYVDFAGFIWRIVRINEDGTIRLILQNGIENNSKYAFNTKGNLLINMYFTNSNIKVNNVLSKWFDTYIRSYSTYNTKVSSAEFCEQAKVSFNDTHIKGSKTDMTLYQNYIPTFKCKNDKNGYGILASEVGLITYDEVVFAGGYVSSISKNNSYYLYNGSNFWTMSPAGFSTSAYIWLVDFSGYLNYNTEVTWHTVRPVINVKESVMVSGSGSSNNPYKIEN